MTNVEATLLLSGVEDNEGLRADEVIPAISYEEYLEERRKRRRYRPREGDNAKLEERRRRRKRRRKFDPGMYVHITSRAHLSARIFTLEYVKQMLGRLCAHYARVCGIELVFYCIMDNHLHLIVRVRKNSRPLDKMMASIKREFSREFKPWFNKVYRRQNNYRDRKLEKGTLWDGPYHPVILETDKQLLACALYVEANRIKVMSPAKLRALEEPPRLVMPIDDGLELLEDGQEGRLQDCYEELLRQIKNYPYQSAPYYLSGRQSEDPWLTDGTDGEWASEEEVQVYWNLPAHQLPKGWRRVWFDGEHRILKPTPAKKRQYPRCGIYERLGSTPERRGENFGRLLMVSVWRSLRREGLVTTTLRACASATRSSQSAGCTTSSAARGYEQTTVT